MSWWRATKTQRANLPRQCFLDPANRKYIICPERGPRQPTCDGLRAARRRTILTGTRCGLEQKAIDLAKKKGCAWAQESTSKCSRRGGR